MYILPEERIAKYPPKVRGTTRLLVYDRITQKIEHKKYSDVTSYIRPGDVIVLNKTKVQNVRTYPTVERTGRLVELLFLDNIQYQERVRSKDKRVKIDEKKESLRSTLSSLLLNEYWFCLIGRAKYVKLGDILQYPDGTNVRVVDRKEGEKGFIIGIPMGSSQDIFNKYGHVPLPPYMKRKDEVEDKVRYNTVFAKRLGSVAAPTASLNITDEMLQKLKNKGVKTAEIELKIGWGTFAPIDIYHPENVKLHSEYYNVSKESAEIINKTIENGRDVWAFGTTVTRVLESISGNGRVSAGEGMTDIFIYPGYKWKIVDHLITNFHMPNSSLILLVSALIGEDEVKRVYNEAINEKYMFLSYGDSMEVI